VTTRIHHHRGDEAERPGLMPQAEVVPHAFFIQTYNKIMQGNNNSNSFQEFKKRLFPNTIGLQITKLGKSVAHLAYGTDKILRDLEFERSPEMSKHNHYLNKQLERLWKYAKKGQRDKFNQLADILLTRSILYRLACLNYNWRS